MTPATVARHLTRRLLAAGCACVARPWTLAFSRDLGVLSLRGEISSNH